TEDDNHSIVHIFQSKTIRNQGQWLMHLTVMQEPRIPHHRKSIYVEPSFRYGAD
ncbi:hypothetical protein RUM43_002169, partial [Polyplax serrata]